MRLSSPAGRRPAGRRTARRPLGALLLAGALAASAGCGTETDGPGDDGGNRATAFDHALAAVPASLADESIMYRDVSRIRPLLKPDGGMYAGLATYGIPELGQYQVDTEKDLGYDVQQVTSSLTVSQTPTSFLTGTFDPDAVSDAMTERGYHASRDDAGTHLAKSGAPSVDVSRTTRVERTSDESPGLPLTPPEKSVLDDPAYRAVSDCLGDTYEASLYQKHAGRDEDVVLLGIGGRLKDGGSSETLCAVTVSKEAAEALAKRLREKETASGRPYAGSKVAVSGGDTPVVSMTWKNKDASDLRPAANDRTVELPSLVLKMY